MKDFEVTIEPIAVEAENKEQAMEFAIEHFTGGNFKIRAEGLLAKQILELIDMADDVTRSDLQGMVDVLASKYELIIEEVK